MGQPGEPLPAPRDLRGASASELSALAAVLYERLGPRVLELGYRYHAGDTTEAEELVAETFARVLVSIGSFRGASSYSTWVYRIAMNVITDWLRRRRTATLDAEPTSPQPAVEHGIAQREQAAAIDRALRSLSPDHRMVLTLVAMEDMSSADAAKILGIPEGTLWSRYARARVAVAERLEQAGIGRDDEP